jgi:hypothetical protein
MMDFPAQPILFSIPVWIYITVRRHGDEGDDWTTIRQDIGWQSSAPIYFLWALGVTLVAGGLGWLAFQMLPPAIFQDPNINLSDYAGMTPSLTTFLMIWLREAIYAALGEEIFFRGFLGGWLNRRWGFIAGNTVQTLVFLLPHLLLLLVSLQLWPILLVQGIAGWLLGWLRHRSGSILPGWIAHSLANALGAFGAM